MMRGCLYLRTAVPPTDDTYDGEGASLLSDKRSPRVTLGVVMLHDSRLGEQAESSLEKATERAAISHMAGVLVAAHLEEEKKCITAPPAGAHHVGRDLKRTTCEEDNM